MRHQRLATGELPTEATLDRDQHPLWLQSYFRLSYRSDLDCESRHCGEDPGFPAIWLVDPTLRTRGVAASDCRRTIASRSERLPHTKRTLYAYMHIRFTKICDFQLLNTCVSSSLIFLLTTSLSLQTKSLSPLTRTECLLHSTITEELARLSC